MATAGTIRAGRAAIEAYIDDSRLRRDIAGLARRLGTLGSAIRNIGLGLAAGTGALLFPVFQATRAYARAGDQLAKLSASTGISVQALESLSYAAGQSSTDIDTVASGLSSMANMLLRADDQSRRTLSTLNRLGVTYAELRQLSPEDRFRRIADAIARIRDPAMAAALANRVFGGSGEALLPMLRNLRLLNAEHSRMVPPFTAADAAAAVRFSDAWARVTYQVRRLRMTLGAAASGEFVKFLDFLSPLLARIGSWVNNNRELAAGLVRLLTLTGLASVGIITLGLSVKLLSWSLIKATSGLKLLTYVMSGMLLPVLLSITRAIITSNIAVRASIALLHILKISLHAVWAAAAAAAVGIFAFGKLLFFTLAAGGIMFAVLGGIAGVLVRVTKEALASSYAIKGITLIYHAFILFVQTGAKALWAAVLAKKAMAAALLILAASIGFTVNAYAGLALAAAVATHWVAVGIGGYKALAVTIKTVAMLVAYSTGLTILATKAWTTLTIATRAYLAWSVAVNIAIGRQVTILLAYTVLMTRAALAMLSAATLWGKFVLVVQAAGIPLYTLIVGVVRLTKSLFVNRLAIVASIKGMYLYAASMVKAALAVLTLANAKRLWIRLLLINKGVTKTTIFLLKSLTGSFFLAAGAAKMFGVALLAAAAVPLIKLGLLIAAGVALVLVFDTLKAGGYLDPLIAAAKTAANWTGNLLMRIGRFLGVAKGIRIVSDYFGDVFSEIRRLSDYLGGVLGPLMSELKAIFIETFHGLRDAMAAGDWEAAGDVLMSGLYAAWRAGVAALGGIWDRFTNAMLQAFAGVVIGVHKMWTDLQNRISTMIVEWASEEGVRGAAARTILGVDPREFADFSESQQVRDFMVSEHQRLASEARAAGDDAGFAEHSSRAAELRHGAPLAGAGTALDATEEMKKLLDAGTAARQAAMGELATSWFASEPELYERQRGRDQASAEAREGLTGATGRAADAKNAAEYWRKLGAHVDNIRAARQGAADTFSEERGLTTAAGTFSGARLAEALFGGYEQSDPDRDQLHALQDQQGELQDINTRLEELDRQTQQLDRIHNAILRPVRYLMGS